MTSAIHTAIALLSALPDDEQRRAIAALAAYVDTRVNDGLVDE